MAQGVLVDANVLLDVLTGDPAWLNWSTQQLRLARQQGPVAVNAIICAEIAPVFNFDWPALDRWLRPSLFLREHLPFESSVLAAAAFKKWFFVDLSGSVLERPGAPG